MPLTSVTNVGLLRSVPGHNAFASFVNMAPDQDVFPHHFACPVISDDEADELDGDADDEASLSSTASLEGDDKDEEVNTTSAPSTQWSDTSDKRPTVIPLDSRPWRTKAEPNKIKTLTRLGECTLVDQLESPWFGLWFLFQRMLQSHYHLRESLQPPLIRAFARVYQGR
jgi:hypothetical protein